MPPPVALLGTVTIPYLGTTLPPIDVMVRYFGPLGDLSHEVVVNFAGFPVQINRVLAGNLVAAGRAVERAGLAGEIRDVGGFRTSIGGSGSPIPFSMHQFGAAFDINEDGGPNGDWHTMTLDPRLVAVLRRFHWFCGENWGGASRDGGHFQFMGGTVPASAGGGGGPVVVGGPGPSHPPVVVAVVVAAMYAGALGLLALAAAGVVAGARRVMSRGPA
jgi:hypothetical protein